MAHLWSTCFCNYIRNRIQFNVVIFHKNANSRSEIENKISQKLILEEGFYFYQFWGFFHIIYIVILFILNNSRSKLLMSTWYSGQVQDRREFDTSLRHFLNFFTKSLSQTWLKFLETLSNEVVLPTTLAQKCATPAVNTGLYTGAKVYHPHPVVKTRFRHP